MPTIVVPVNSPVTEQDPSMCCKASESCLMYLGFLTGMGIPTVIGSWVSQVWVQCGIWHTATYRVPVPQCHGYFTDISWVYYYLVSINFIALKLIFSQI